MTREFTRSQARWFIYRKNKNPKMMETIEENGHVSTLQRKLTDDIRRVMERKELSQAQMAAQCNVSSGTFSELLHHKRPFASGLLGRLSRVLGDFSSGKHLKSSLTIK